MRGWVVYSIRRVKEMTEDTAEEIRTLHQLCFGDPIEKQFDPEEQGEWWLAYKLYNMPHVGTISPPVVAGFGALCSSVIVQDYAFLMRTGVLPEHRGHRLQYRLCRVRERYAKRCGYKGLVSYTIDNPHSANNLIRFGMLAYVPPWNFATDIANYWKKDF